MNPDSSVKIVQFYDYYRMEIVMNTLLNKITKAIAVITVLSTFIILSACGKGEKEDTDKKIQIVTTLFPQYDFARQIAGDKAEVTLLLKPGTESHDYDPTPADMISINDADLFIYTGEYMEGWAANILDSVDNKELNILDVSKGITLCKTGEDEHEHSEKDEHAKEDEGHNHEYDPHIWTSPKNAIVMMNNILEEIIKLDPENEAYYRENAEKYIAEIESIDTQIRDIVANAKYDTIYFGGRFAMLYFVNEYGLKYVSAFDSCSTETEPGAKLVAAIVDEMKSNGAKVVFYEELASPKTAEAIAEEVDGETLLLHSCHNVSSDEFENGATYVSIMKQNVINLEKGLN